MIDQVERPDGEARDQFAIEGEREIGAVHPALCARGLINAVAMELGGDGQAKWRTLAIEQAIAKVERSALKIELAAVADIGDAGDVVQRGDAADLDAEVRQRHDFDLDLLRQRAIGSASLAEPPCRLSL